MNSYRSFLITRNFDCLISLSLGGTSQGKTIQNLQLKLINGSQISKSLVLYQ